jgi:hypothetical protein
MSSPPLPASESFDGNPSIVLAFASPMKVKKNAILASRAEPRARDLSPAADGSGPGA